MALNSDKIEGGGIRMKIRLSAKDALIVGDVQVDFLPGGALAVANGDQVIPSLNHYIEIFAQEGLPVYFIRDWHPRSHLSFKENGGLWPNHCVMDTPGAMFPQTLLLPADNKYIISKGMRCEFDAYSAFQDTLLYALLQERGIQRVFIGGLATDYCVKNTVFGALNLGFQSVVLLDAIQGINIHKGDSEKAVEQMLFGGAFGMTLQIDQISQK